MFHRRLSGLAHIHISECLVWQGPEHAAHADVPHQRCRSSGQGGGELLHATSDVTGLPKKTLSKDKSGHGPKVIKVARLCFMEELRKNCPLRALLNIPWHSSSLGDSIFYHKGSRRTSASERILAELGTFQGPGLRGPFGLCGVPGILLREATLPSLLLPSL